MKKSYMTVVFEFADDNKRIEKAQEFNNIFPGVDGDPIRVTAISGRDEITKLDLIEFGREIGDIDFIGRVIDQDNIESLLEIMLKCNEYASENSCSISYAYEAYEQGTLSA